MSWHGIAENDLARAIASRGNYSFFIVDWSRGSAAPTDTSCIFNQLLMPQNLIQNCRARICRIWCMTFKLQTLDLTPNKCHELNNKNNMAKLSIHKFDPHSDPCKSLQMSRVRIKISNKFDNQLMWHSLKYNCLKLRFPKYAILFIFNKGLLHNSSQF